MKSAFPPSPVVIGADHAGFAHKEVLKKVLADLHLETDDKGTHSTDSSDYPDYAHAVANAVEIGTAGVGVLVCGSGNGVCMTANKHRGVRAALAWNEEIARLSREHNDANVLCIPARYVSEEEAATMLKTFLSTAFEGGRHERRKEKIDSGAKVDTSA